MRLKTVTGSIVAAAMALAPVAAQAVAVVGNVSGHGDAMIARNGKLLRINGRAPLLAGDRVVTRAGGSAQVAMNSGCSTTLGQSAMFTASAGCSAEPVSFDHGRAGYQGRSSAIAGTALVIAVLAAAAVTAGVVAAATEDNNSSTSP